MKNSARHLFNHIDILGEDIPEGMAANYEQLRDRAKLISMYLVNPIIMVSPLMHIALSKIWCELVAYRVATGDLPLSPEALSIPELSNGCN